MLIAAISDSACKYVPPILGILFAIYAAISVCGVIGYPKKCLHPDIIAASAKASLPFIKTRSGINYITYLSTIIATSGHIVAHAVQPIHFL